MMLNYAKWLLSPWIKVLVIVTYLAPVIFAAFTVRDLKPGLPYRQTVPQNSIIMNFLDDVDEFYHGSFPVKLVVVFEKTAPEDFGLVREVLDGMLELPYINRVYPDWLADYETWYGCQGDMEDPRGMESMCNLKHFLSDGDYFPCDPTNFTRSNNRRQLALATSAANGPRAPSARPCRRTRGCCPRPAPRRRTCATPHRRATPPLAATRRFRSATTTRWAWARALARVRRSRSPRDASTTTASSRSSREVTCATRRVRTATRARATPLCASSAPRRAVRVTQRAAAALAAAGPTRRATTSSRQCWAARTTRMTCCSSPRSRAAATPTCRAPSS
ncbi:hypothetical protein T492DRAFT_338357 [Pavlovales sp. CCMP2436]|nr:hypothetical protein T492DRAFT_338357 [Pavlovales sp. CCMP2436]